MRYFYYKLKVDSGGAPCVYRNTLTLAICKPSIRTTAQVGDWIFGFGARSTIGERLIYIAEVTEVFENGVYYRESRFRDRPDCIYQWSDGQLVWERDSRFHEGGDERDIGSGPHAKTRVLLSRNFRYFGAKGTEAYKRKYPAIASAIEKLTRGHRVNHSAGLETELTDLREWSWKRYSDRKLGPPSDPESIASCSRTEGPEQIVVCR